jgi:DNA polymerase III delta prime subunit
VEIGKSFLFFGSNAEELKKIAADMAKDFLPADIFWLFDETKNATITVKEIAEFLPAAHLSALGKNGKIMIIFDASNITPQAQNKMLKTIEDAPAHTTFVLLATRDETVLSTIKSRCVQKYLPTPIDNKPLLPPEIVDTLKNIFGVEIDEKTLNIKQKHDIINALARVNRNAAANCNEKNAQDLIIMEILKCVKR